MIDNIENMSYPELRVVLAELKAKVTSIENQLGAYNRDQLFNLIFDEDWERRAKSSRHWCSQEIAEVKAEMTKRAIAQNNTDVPSSRGNAFTLAAKTILPAELRKQIWTEAERLYPHLWEF